MTFRELLHRSGITQRKLAGELGIAHQNIEAWATGKSKPRCARLPRLCELLKCTERELITALMETEAERCKRT